MARIRWVYARGVDALHLVQVPGRGTVTFAGFRYWTSIVCSARPRLTPWRTVAPQQCLARPPSRCRTRVQPWRCRLPNPNTTPSEQLRLECVPTATSTTTFSVVRANSVTDFTTPRSNSRTVLRVSPAPVPGVGGVAEEARVAALPVG